MKFLHRLTVGFICGAFWTLSHSSLFGGAAALVKNGKGHATVVIADRPSPVASYAANELASHIRKATGVDLPIVHESQITESSDLLHVYIGETAAARRLGLTAESLAPDESISRFVDGSLFILGREGDREPLDVKAGSLRGTLFGVYGFLERSVKVRWLWPGDLGTYVPKTAAIEVDTNLYETTKPSLRFRRARISHVRKQVNSPDPLLTEIGFSNETAQSYLNALEIFLSRHRLGDTEAKPVVGHNFAGWWPRHGAAHPEWFMLNDEGKRGPRSNATKNQSRHTAMCVSNPELHRYIVEEYWDGGDNLSLGEVDVRSFCHCEECLSWDGPQPVDPPEFARPDYTPRNVSDRYARFWKTIHALASKKNPNVRVTTFLYWNYFPAPASGILLNKNIYGEYVPWTGAYVYFPMPPEREQWLRTQWLKWSESGITMAYRPNHLLGGYVFSAISTWQAGEFFKFAYQNGMQGFDYDSLYGHWAVKGPMLYMHMRLFAEPDANIAEIRKEYFEAFGPAAKLVEEYFDYWEKRSERSGVQGGNPVDLISKYPESAFEGARGYLAEALKAAQQSPDSQYAERVQFLQVGLEHGALAAKLVRSIGRRAIPDVPAGAFGDDGFTSTAELPKDAQRYLKYRQALLDLVAFRRQHEHLFFADLVAAASVEKRRLEAGRLLSPAPQPPPPASK